MRGTKYRTIVVPIIAIAVSSVVGCESSSVAHPIVQPADRQTNNQIRIVLPLLKPHDGAEALYT